MNKKGKIIGLSLAAIMVVSLFAVAIPGITAIANGVGKPDLVITDTWVDGNRVHYTIENIGDADAPTSYTGLWINDHYSARDRVDPLAPGEESDEVFAREKYEDGEVKVCADYQNRIEEDNEGNNCRVGLLPDLIIIDKHETVDADACTFTVTYTVKNVGSAKAGASTTTTTVGGVDDNFATPALDPGAEVEHTTATAFDCDPDGSDITVTADSAGVVDESDETNNDFENEFLCCPDLIITEKEEAVDVDTCTFTVTYTVKNVGNCKAGESTTTTTVGGVDDDFVTPALAPGAEVEHTTATAFDCDPDGSDITVRADSAGVVDECDETNNDFENEFLCCPDLIITNKHENLDVDACTFTVTYTVKNVGNCKAAASTTTTTVDVVTDDFATPALAPGAEVEHTTATGFNCVPGGVEVTVTADSADAVEECDETNNEVTNTYYCCPDLIITEKQENLDADACTFTVTYTVKNVGNCTAAASTTTTTVGADTDDYDTPALAPGAEVEHTTATAFDCDPAGSDITVTADSAGVVDECDEGNNDFENEFLCCPDLIITEKQENLDADAWTFTVTYTVKNAGNCKAGASTTTTTDGTDTDNYATPALAPGAEVEHTTATAFDCVPGGADVTVTADSAGVVDECDETNNEVTNTYECCPDLIITEKEETVDVETYTFTVTYTVKNVGNCKAGASTTTTTVGVVDDNFATPALAPGAEIEHTTAAAFDCDPDGADVTVTADSAGVVEECNEGNNEMTNTVICHSEPDLVITDIWVVDNRIHYTIQNIGGEPAPRSYTGLWINDDYSARDRVDPLAPGGESDGVFARENYKGGDIEVCADYQNRIEEANEGNNCMVGGDDQV
jgi:subtilase family serine protease